MLRGSYIVVFALLLASYGPVVEGFACYECNSASDSRCGEDDFSLLKSNYRTQTGCNYCTKVVAASALVTRGCASVCPSLDLGLLGGSYCCDSLLCNGAGYTRTSFTAMAAAFLAYLLLKN